MSISSLCTHHISYRKISLHPHSGASYILIEYMLRRKPCVSMNIALFYILLTCSNTSPSSRNSTQSGSPRAPVVDSDRWEDTVLWAVLLQKCLLSFPSSQFSMTPVSRLSQSPGAGLRQGLSALLHNYPFFLPPCHLAVIIQPCLLPPSLALTYTVPYLCCKYNIKLSRE